MSSPDTTQQPTQMNMCTSCNQYLGDPAPAGGSCPYCSGTIHHFVRVTGDDSHDTYDPDTHAALPRTPLSRLADAVHRSVLHDDALDVSETDLCDALEHAFDALDADLDPQQHPDPAERDDRDHEEADETEAPA